MDRKKLLNYGIIFLLIYIILSVFIFPRPTETPVSDANFEIRLSQKEYEQGSIVNATLHNNTALEVKIKAPCPFNPLQIQKKDKGSWTTVESTAAEIDCTGTEEFITVPANGQYAVNFANWNYLFHDTGIYKLTAFVENPEAPLEDGNYDSLEFEIKPQGIFGFLWTAGFYQPIFNALIFLASIVPGHDLGLAIILLTIIFRTILLIPSQRALKSQRVMQELQPKLKHIQEKYKGNQEKIAQETMMLWKSHKVNPLGSCLPLLIQMPILIGIFYVIQTGLSPNNVHLLYGPLQNFSLTSIQTNFLGILELTHVNLFVLPLIVGGLQFGQMKLAMMRKKNKEETPKKQKTEMEMASKMMIYIMPVMIAVFTASVPAGVGLYWIISTLYGIGQQLVVNRQVDEEGSKIRVIKK